MSDTATLNEWVEKHPDDYRWLLITAKMFAQRGQRFSVKQLVEGFRWERFSNGDLAGYKWNNTYTAALARRLMEDAPEIRPFIRTRRARCDSEEAAA